MSIKPLFDCLLCCDEHIVMKKISKDTLKKYNDFQFKPYIPHYVNISNSTLTANHRQESAPAPKVKHWAFFHRMRILEEVDKANEPERSMLRKEFARHHLSFEEQPHDIYDPQFSSDEELLSTCSISGEDGARLTVRTSIPKKPKKLKKKSGTKRRAMLQAFVKSLGKIK